MDAFIYVRWSSAEQGKGSSLERQLDDCRAHADHKGWNVADVIKDEGVSAFKGKHATVGALGRFIDRVEAGEFPDGVILLTEKLDRLSREKAKIVVGWMARITEMGVVVATVDGDRLYDSDNFDMTTIIEVVVKAQLSNEESEKKASRIAAAWKAKRGRLERGEPGILTRRAPAWLSVEGAPPKFVVLEPRAAIVRRVFEETVAGLGKHQIARNLNRDGVPTFGRAAGWHASYIQKILNSNSVLGEFQPGRKPRGEARQTVGNLIPDYYPQIVDADLYASARRSMAGRQRRVAGRGRRLVNLFSGLATCKSCSSRMTFRGKGLKQRANGEWVNEDFLICDSYQRGLGCASGYHFNYRVWESGILDAILLDAMEDRHFSSAEAVRPIEIELAERIRRRADVKEQSEKALSLYLETERPQVKARWMRLVEDIDEHDRAVLELERRLQHARGIVSPDEHRRRIFALRDTLEDEDEDIRFETRARVMEAVHDLVASMKFSTIPLIEIATKDGVDIVVCWEDWGPGARGTTWTKFMPS